MPTQEQLNEALSSLPPQMKAEFAQYSESQQRAFIGNVADQIDAKMQKGLPSDVKKSSSAPSPGIGGFVNDVSSGIKDDFKSGMRDLSGIANGLTVGLARPAVKAVSGQDIGEGSMLGRVAGTMIPAGMAGKGIGILAKGASPLVRGALQLGGEGATTALGSTPEESFRKYLQNAPKDIIGGGATNMAIGGVLNLVGKGYNLIPDNAKKLASREINSLIGSAKNKFMYGKNPGMAIVDEGITANSLEELGQKVNDAKQNIWNQVKSMTSNSNKTVDLTGVEKPLDDLLVRLNKSPNSNSVIIKRVNDAKDDLLGIVRDKKGSIISQRDLSKLTPTEVMDLKQQIGDITKFSKDTITDDNLINGALKSVYGKTKASLDAVVKGVSKLTEKYASLIDAGTSITNKIRSSESKPIIPLAQRIAGAGMGALMGAGGGGVGSAIGGAVGLASEMGLEKFAGSTMAKTRFAQWLANNLSKSPRASLDGAKAISRVMTGVGAGSFTQK